MTVLEAIDFFLNFCGNLLSEVARGGISWD
jgi:hypothetical protein